jgi:hypothetical protein
MSVMDKINLELALPPGEHTDLGRLFALAKDEDQAFGQGKPVAMILDFVAQTCHHLGGHSKQREQINTIIVSS